MMNIELKNIEFRRLHFCIGHSPFDILRFAFQRLFHDVELADLAEVMTVNGKRDRQRE
jgi:hypothetical protein